MSTTTPPATIGWTAARARRARWFAMFLLAAAVIAMWAMFQPWFAWATPGLAPSCEPAPTGSATISVQSPNRAVLDGISARGCVTGLETVATYDSPEGTAAGVTAAQQSMSTVFKQQGPAQMLGMPRVATVLVGCLALAAFGVASRRGWIVIVALFFMQIPHKDLTQLRQKFLGDSMSSLTVSLPAVQYFTWALLGGTAVMLAAMIFVLKVNFEHRAHLRKVARAEGNEDPAEPLDWFTTYLGRKIGKVKSAAQAEGSHHDVPART